MRAILIPTSRLGREKGVWEENYLSIYAQFLFSVRLSHGCSNNTRWIWSSPEFRRPPWVFRSDMAAGSHEESYQDFNRKLYWKYILNFPFYSLFSELHLHLNNCLNFLISFRGVFVWSSSNALCFSNFWKYSLFLSRFAFSCSRFFCFLKIE